MIHIDRNAKNLLNTHFFLLSNLSQCHPILLSHHTLNSQNHFFIFMAKLKQIDKAVLCGEVYIVKNTH